MSAIEGARKDSDVDDLVQLSENNVDGLIDNLRKRLEIIIQERDNEPIDL